MTFRKNDTVKLNDALCFTTENGGERQFCLINIHCDESGIVYGRRAPTSEETEAWYASDASKGMDSAGETKLPPRAVSVTLRKGETFTVVRGRARMTCVWGNPVKGYTLIRTESGEECFVRRELLTHA